MSARPAEAPMAAAVTRLAALFPLDADARSALDRALQRPRSTRARREIMAENKPVAEPLLVLSGWAARVQLVEDGQRQILDFLLPGDLIGLFGEAGIAASPAVVAITDVDLCPAPAAGASPALARAYAISRAMEESRLLAQITRIGRRNAQERIVDLLLEFLDRLELAGLATNGRFPLPLTQEMMADALGLTSVHVNRMLQVLRREGSIDWKGREIVITDPVALGRSIGRAVFRPN